jgi:hypothetical protein
MVMRKYITSTLLCLSISYIIHAQENVYPDVAKISKPFVSNSLTPFKGKNLYFGGDWVKARLLTSNNNILSSDTFFFNYDKIDRRLLVTSDFKSIFEIDRREFKAIEFYLNDSAYFFKHIYYINDKDLFQILVRDEGRYALYKVMHTKIVRGTIGTFGNITLVPTSNYLVDRYVDFAEYYIFFPNKDYRSFFTIKRSAIKRLFGLNPESGKVDDFFNMIGDKNYDESDLIQMVSYLNSGSL